MTQEEIKTLYSVERQFLYSLYEERCHRGSAPTLAQIVEECTLKFTMEHVEGFIIDLQAFTSAQRKMNQHQLQQLTFIICTQFKRMKITEFMLFCVKAKSGDFGKFYATIDPMDIVSALHRWMGTCDALQAAAWEESQRVKAREEREANRETSISYEQAVERGIIKEKWRKLLKH